MAYTPIDKVETETKVTKKETPKKTFEDKARNAGKVVNLTLSGGQVIARKVGLVLLGAAAGVSLVGSLTGVVYTSGFLINGLPSVALQYAIPTVAFTFISKKTVPVFTNNCKLTKPLHDKFSGVVESFKRGVGGFEEEVSKKGK